MDRDNHLGRFHEQRCEMTQTLLVDSYAPPSNLLGIVDDPLFPGAMLFIDFGPVCFVSVGTAMWAEHGTDYLVYV